MKYSAKENAILLLADGTHYYGKSIGFRGTSGGEICFNTGMTGYQEIYTDPSYYGQVIVNTTAHIGNYGVNDHEQESDKPKIAGLVVNDFSIVTSRFTGNGSLQDYLERNRVVGIANIDTRSIVRRIRNLGAMNCVISADELDPKKLRDELDRIPSMEGLELSSVVSTAEPYTAGAESASYRVAVLDYGIKKSILKQLVSRDCYCRVFPARTTFEEMEAWKPDGYFLSNGPGDPAAMSYAVDTTRRILESSKAVFGICLGHQILALASGVSTFKMHHGHRGLNHPIKNLDTGLCEITSQNHGFCVSAEDIGRSGHVVVTHVNLNDQTVAGIRRIDRPAFSVQYHPESSPGPHDSRYLFDQFIDLMSKN
jgi:carbamoyl-phosphate synthase small subunit